MEKTLIAELGYENSDFRIYGSTTGGSWAFWQERESFTMNPRNPNGLSRQTSDKTASLADAVPKKWIILAPRYIHPDFVTWFKAEYPQQLAGLTEQMRRWYDQILREHWRAILQMGEDA